MAKAIKCDRCGTYTQTFDQEEFQFIMWESKPFFQTHKKVPVDLCPKCLDSLAEWFNGHAGEGEDDG